MSLMRIRKPRDEHHIGGHSINVAKTYVIDIPYYIICFVSQNLLSPIILFNFS